MSSGERLEGERGGSRQGTRKKKPILVRWEFGEMSCHDHPHLDSERHLPDVEMPDLTPV